MINSQRAIMADLENSVASWKTRMKTQAELIHKLMVSNGTSSAAGQSPPSSDAEADEVFGQGSPRRHKQAGWQQDAQHTLPRTTHLALSSTNNSVPTPYYGAHTFNRPPSTIGSPTKPFSNSSTVDSWSYSSPHPLPLPGSGDSVSPSKRKPRKTIEMDLKLLKSSPRVESSKNRFNLENEVANSADTPTKRRATNASAYYI